MYIDLVNEKLQILQTLQVPVNHGTAPGNFVIPGSISAGNYVFRAYTDLMVKNQQPHFFHKLFTIGTPTSTGIANLKNGDVLSGYSVASSDEAQFQFCPEGGQFLNELSSLITFKQPSDFSKGFVEDDNHLIVTEVKFTPAGIGFFRLKPKKNKNYKLVLSNSSGKVKTIPLPVAKDSGYLLSADNSNVDTLVINLRCTEDLVNRQNLIFVPLSNGMPLFSYETRFPEKEIFIKVPKSRLPAGIIRLKLFDSSQTVISERFIFNKDYNNVRIAINDFQSGYRKSEAINLDMHVFNGFGKPVIGEFSISVLNADLEKETKMEEETIYTTLLLSSELEMENMKANYFLDADKSRQELDLLMALQTGDSLRPESLTNSHYHSTGFFNENKIGIKGVINAASKIKIDKIPVTLLAGELGSGALFDTKTDNRGIFSFSINDSLKYLPMRLQVKTKSNDKYQIRLLDYQPPKIDRNTAVLFQNTSFRGDESLVDIKQNQTTTSEIASNGKVINLKEVTIKNYDRTPKLSRNSSSVNLAGGADKIFTAEFIDKFPSLGHIIMMLPGVIPNPRGPGYVQRSDVGMKTPAPILLLVDGVEGFSDVNVSSHDIESVEFLKTAAYAGMYGIRGGGGVILVTTKRGTYNSSTINSRVAPNSLTFNLPFVQQASFEDKTIKKNGSTIFWSNKLSSDSEGKMKVSFTNGITPGNYKITIEGVSIDGELCRQVFRYRID